MILRNLAQESSKSELWWRRYNKKSFEDLSTISRKWLGLYLEIFLDFRVLFGIFVDCSLISNKSRVLFATWRGFFGFGIIFEWKNAVDLAHGSVDRARVAGPRVCRGRHSGRRPKLTRA
jgi:hypothetical protein